MSAMSQCVKLIMLVKGGTPPLKRDQQINKDRREERIRVLYRAEVRRQLQKYMATEQIKKSNKSK